MITMQASGSSKSDPLMAACNATAFDVDEPLVDAAEHLFDLRSTSFDIMAASPDPIEDGDGCAASMA
jgi:hypothetical protein